MSRDWDKELGDFLRAAGDPVGDSPDEPIAGDDAPPPVVAYLRQLADEPDTARATKVLVIMAYAEGAGPDDSEYISRHPHGATFSEQLGLVAYQYERLRRHIVGED